MGQLSLKAVAAGAVAIAVPGFVVDLLALLLLSAPAKIALVGRSPGIPLEVANALSKVWGVFGTVLGTALYVLGGYVAGTMVGSRGGSNGVPAALVGFLLGLALGPVLFLITPALLAVSSIEGVTMPMFADSSWGSPTVGIPWLSVITPLLALPLLLRGYLGGKLGERRGAA